MIPVNLKGPRYDNLVKTGEASYYKVVIVLVFHS